MYEILKNTQERNNMADYKSDAEYDMQRGAKRGKDRVKEDKRGFMQKLREAMSSSHETAEARKAKKDKEKKY